MTLHERLLLLRAIKSGKHPRYNPADVCGIEPAEVHRLYPAARAAVDARAVELYNKLIHDDLRADRDAWRGQAQRLARRVLHRRWWWSRTDAT
jgi:hypothetical protein